LFSSGRFLKIIKVAHILGDFLPQLRLCIDFHKKVLGFILGDFFSQTHLVTLFPLSRTEKSAHNGNQRPCPVYISDGLWPGLPVFSLCNIPKWEKYTQITTKFTKWPLNKRNDNRIDLMDIKFTNIFHCKTLQSWPKLGFLVWNYTIWQPCLWQRRKSKFWRSVTLSAIN
jgi:hypothetical protein